MVAAQMSDHLGSQLQSCCNPSVAVPSLWGPDGCETCPTQSLISGSSFHQVCEPRPSAATTKHRQCPSTLSRGHALPTPEGNTDMVFRLKITMGMVFRLKITMGFSLVPSAMHMRTNVKCVFSWPVAFTSIVWSPRG